MGCIDYCSSVTKYLPQITEGRASSGSHSESIVHHGREGIVAGVSGAAGRMASPVRMLKEVNTGIYFFFFLFFFFFFSLIWDLAHGMVLPIFRTSVCLQLNFSGDIVRHVHECVSTVILKTVTLTMKSDHHGVVLYSGACWRTTLYIVKIHP